jgi:hypothetical protein
MMDIEVCPCSGEVTINIKEGVVMDGDNKNGGAHLSARCKRCLWVETIEMFSPNLDDKNGDFKEARRMLARKWNQYCQTKRV